MAFGNAWRATKGLIRVCSRGGSLIEPPRGRRMGLLVATFALSMKNNRFRPCEADAENPSIWLGCSRRAPRTYAQMEDSDRRHLRLPETRPPIVDTHSLWIHNWGSVRRACRRVVRVGFVVLASHRYVGSHVRGGPARIACSFWERLRSAADQPLSHGAGRRLGRF